MTEGGINEKRWEVERWRLLHHGEMLKKSKSHELEVAARHKASTNTTTRHGNM